MTSTAPGRGAIAIVRLSGRDAFAIARKLTTQFPDTPRTVTLCHLHAPNDRCAVIDRGLVTRFDAPASYTGEDLVEFALHGGPLVSALVVEACVAAGARAALPGEFTERAVLSGKMDLVQAEAVADLIDARSRAAHRAAVHQLDGALSRRLMALRESLLEVDALIAYDIDFPAEDDETPGPERVLAACDASLAQVERLLATLPAAALGRDGALVVLAGPPNAGKSALVNAIVGEARVIVSNMPGTTRDAVEVLVDDMPFPLRLVDTAGLRAPDDLIERMGIEISERYVAQAHVVLVCAETAESLSATVRAVMPLTQGKIVRVLTKSDLSSTATQGRKRITEDAENSFGEGSVAVSAVTGEGIEVLRDCIRHALRDHEREISDETPLVTRVRHEGELRRAWKELSAFRSAWREGLLPAPVAATHLRGAVSALESLIGAVDVEDILAKVFRTFCVGK